MAELKVRSEWRLDERLSISISRTERRRSDALSPGDSLRRVKGANVPSHGFAYYASAMTARDGMVPNTSLDRIRTAVRNWRRTTRSEFSAISRSVGRTFDG